MKQLKYLLLILIAAITFSCEEKLTYDAQLSEMIVGEWVEQRDTNRIEFTKEYDNYRTIVYLNKDKYYWSIEEGQLYLYTIDSKDNFMIDTYEIIVLTKGNLSIGNTNGNIDHYDRVK